MNIVTKKFFMLLIMISPAVENKVKQEENWIGSWMAGCQYWPGFSGEPGQEGVCVQVYFKRLAPVIAGADRQAADPGEGVMQLIRRQSDSGIPSSSWDPSLS